MRGKKELAACICVTKKYDTRFLLSIIQLNFDSTCIEMNFQILYGLLIKLGQKIKRFLRLGKGERLQFLQCRYALPSFRCQSSHQNARLSIFLYSDISIRTISKFASIIRKCRKIFVLISVHYFFYHLYAHKFFPHQQIINLIKKSYSGIVYNA